MFAWLGVELSIFTNCSRLVSLLVASQARSPMALVLPLTQSSTSPEVAHMSTLVPFGVANAAVLSTDDLPPQYSLLKKIDAPACVPEPGSRRQMVIGVAPEVVAPAAYPSGVCDQSVYVPVMMPRTVCRDRFVTLLVIDPLALLTRIAKPWAMLATEVRVPSWVAVRPTPKDWPLFVL